jgi:NADH-quinone oxidoreductase subunit E
LNELLSKYSEEVQQTLLKYPTDRKRSAVMPLLYLAQREAGYITKKGIEDIADVLEMTVTEVVSIIGFYTLYHNQPGGLYHIQVCTDLPCALRGADDFLEKLCQNLGVRVGDTTSDGLFTIEEVKCLAGCDRAPVFQMQGDGEISYYENQTVESAAALFDELRQKAQGSGQFKEADK